MRLGLLWYDDDPQMALADKIGRAAARYRQKFGRLPELCYLNPQAMGGKAGDEAGLSCQLESLCATVRLIPASYVLAHHFLLTENGGGQAGG